MRTKFGSGSSENCKITLNINKIVSFSLTFKGSGDGSGLAWCASVRVQASILLLHCFYSPNYLVIQDGHWSSTHLSMFQQAGIIGFGIHHFHLHPIDQNLVNMATPLETGK